MGGNEHELTDREYAAYEELEDRAAARELEEIRAGRVQLSPQEDVLTRAFAALDGRAARTLDREHLAVAREIADEEAGLCPPPAPHEEVRARIFAHMEERAAREGVRFTAAVTQEGAVYVAQCVEAEVASTRLRAADAFYVWVARREDVPLVTLDAEVLARAATVDVTAVTP